MTHVNSKTKARLGVGGGGGGDGSKGLNFLVVWIKTALFLY